jgi:hypothetical protein
VLAAPLHAVVAAQEPDAPADDGTGGSADAEPDDNPQPGAVEQDIIPRPNSGHDPTALLATRGVRRGRAPAEPAERAP